MSLEFIPELFLSGEKIYIPSKNSRVKNPTILEEQSRVGHKLAKYLGTKFVRPKSYYGYLSHAVKGVKKKKNDTNYIIYYWNITYNPPDIKRVPRHEMGHVEIDQAYGKGTEALLSFHTSYIFSDGVRSIRMIIPTGRILVEGGVERLLEKINEEKTGSYTIWYSMVYEIDNITPIEGLYSIAENEGIEAVSKKLDSSRATKVIDNYARSLVKKIDPDLEPIYTDKTHILFD